MNEATKRLLRDLGYFVGLEGNSYTFYCAWAPSKAFLTPKHAVREGEAWAACLAHAESDGLWTNFPRVAALLGDFGFETEDGGFGDGGMGVQAFLPTSGKAEKWTDLEPSHEAAAFALLRKVMAA